MLEILIVGEFSILVTLCACFFENCHPRSITEAVILMSRTLDHLYPLRISNLTTMREFEIWNESTELRNNEQHMQKHNKQFFLCENTFRLVFNSLC